ncbi:MAG: translation initiation factor IF-2 [Candidatus Lernaella stagnicola]|nr:translation initiation factor IF-2 [Candidatus Lernaella stagnicola]
MAKITVEVAAKRLGMEPVECLKRLQEMGLMVRDQLDKIDADVFQQVKSKLDEEKLRANDSTSSTTKRVGSTVIRRRRKARPEPEIEVVEEPEPDEEEAAPIEVEAQPDTEPIESAPPAEDEVVEAAEAGEPEEIVAETVVEAQVPDLAEEAVEEPPEKPVADKPVETAESEAVVAEEVPKEGDKESKKAKTKPKKPPSRRVATLEDIEPKRINFGDPHHESARILSKPKIPMEPLKTVEKPRADQPTGDTPGRTLPGGERRERKGRRVVDFGDRSRRKDQERERGFFRKGQRKKKRTVKQTEITTPKAIKRKIQVSEQITVGDLAKRMAVKGGELIKRLLNMGVMVTVNQDIDFETAQILGSEFGLEVEKANIDVEDIILVADTVPENLAPRPPVVTIMGHVDHGKTSLLDAIRETDVASGEAGGITQHIAAYNITLSKARTVTFVDTPGHHSFAAMRARGAHVTDIVVLVVAAEDGVMPQTVESINHAKDAGVPIVVAINKIDKAGANPEKITRELMEQGLVPEAVGGETLFVQVSAKKRTGIEELLEAILLQAELMELRADPTVNAVGIVLDARLERGRGPVADVIIREGTLRQADYIVADTNVGRVRMMFDDKGRQLDSVPPGMPAQVVGLNGVPTAGAAINMLADEKKAKQVASIRENQLRSAEQKRRSNIRLEDLFAKAQEGEIKALRVVIKCDVHGSAEAVRDSLLKLGNEEIQVKIIHYGVGTITETDINLASASEAIIIGFNVRPEAKAKGLADALGVEIRMYSVIYDLIDDVTAALEGMLSPTFSEVVNGVAEVRDTFHIRKTGTIAGCYVLEGKIIRNAKVRILREGVVLHTGNISNLKRFKDDAKEVAAGFECGINIDGFNDVQPGDQIESFSVTEERPTL